MPHRCPIREKRALEIGVDRGLPTRFRAFVQRSIAMLPSADPRDMIEHIQTAQEREGFLEQTLHLPGIRSIAAREENGPAFLQRGEGLGPFLSGTSRYRDHSSFFEKARCRSQAQAGCAADAQATFLAEKSRYSCHPGTPSPCPPYNAARRRAYLA